MAVKVDATFVPTPRKIAFSVGSFFVGCKAPLWVVDSLSDNELILGRLSVRMGSSSSTPPSKRLGELGNLQSKVRISVSFKGWVWPNSVPAQDN